MACRYRAWSWKADMRLRKIYYYYYYCLAVSAADDVDDSRSEFNLMPLPLSLSLSFHCYKFTALSRMIERIAIYLNHTGLWHKIESANVVYLKSLKKKRKIFITSRRSYAIAYFMKCFIGNISNRRTFPLIYVYIQIESFNSPTSRRIDSFEQNVYCTCTWHRPFTLVYWGLI